MKVIVRKAVPADLPRLQQLATELMLSERRFDPLLESKWYVSEEGKKFLLKSIKGENQICFLAQAGNKTIGYASCIFHASETWRSTKRAELNELVVTQQYRRHGVGHQLMAAFKEWARDRGATQVKVIVSTPNKDGIRFYEDNGFKDSFLTMQAEL